MTSKNYDIKILQDYLAGKLDAKAMHALERQALEDPVLSAALEGLMQHAELDGKDIEAAMQRLNSRLDARVQAGSYQNIAVSATPNQKKTDDDHAKPPMSPVDGLRSQGEQSVKGAGSYWWRIAAIILVILAGGWFYYLMQGKHGAAKHGANQPIALNSADTSSGYAPSIPTHKSKVSSMVDELLSDSLTTQQHLAKTKIAQTDQNKVDKKVAGKKSAGLDKTLMEASGLSKADSQKDLMATSSTGASLSALPNRPPLKVKGNSDTANGEPLMAMAAATKQKSMVAAGDARARLMARPSELSDPSYLSDSTAILGKNAQIAAGRQGKNRMTHANMGKAKMMASQKVLVRGLPKDSLRPGLRKQPLYVVNGNVISQDAIQQLDVETIEKISVMKAAKAIAIYGDKASNGAILITTKMASQKGQDGLQGPVAARKSRKDPLRTLQNRSMADLLTGNVAGLVVQGAAKQPVNNQGVHIELLRGHLSPAGGFKALREYLATKRASAINRGTLLNVDTGKVTFEVHLEKTRQGGSRARIEQVSSTNKRLGTWFKEVSSNAGGWPDWEVEKDYLGRKDAGPALVEITISHAY